MNFPGWVTDATQVPSQYVVAAKKFLYVVAACEYARRLHNAGWKWFRGKPLDAIDEDALADAFPTLFPGDPPSESQLRAYLENIWEPRQNAVQAARAEARMRLENFDLTWVDWEGLIG